MRAGLFGALIGTAAATVALAALFPLLHRSYTRAENADRLAALQLRVVDGPRLVRTAGDRQSLLRVRQLEPHLASWATVGGCGIGGAGPGSAGGGVKWVGRNVTGGLVDAQVLVSSTFLEDGSATVINMRSGTTIGDTWLVALNVPFLYKTHKVQVPISVVDTEEKTARLPGWGDISFEVTRKLGLTNAHTLTLAVAMPTGSHDAVRQGVILPQQAQLGAGTFSGYNFSGWLQYEHTFDKIWGLIITGGSLAYGGGENDLGDYRSESASAYAHVGYLVGPLVPAIGLNLTGKSRHDRERYEILDQPLYLASITGSVEWSSDYVAVLLGSSTSLSARGLETWTILIGVSTSVF